MRSVGLGALARAAMVPVIFFGLSGYAMADSNSSGGGGDQSVPDNGSPYQDLVNEENQKAFDKFTDLYANHPDDPYVQLDLGLANQRLGHFDVALPLYRKAMETGKDVYPPVVTSDPYKGHTIRYIACENIKIGTGWADCVPPSPKHFVLFFDTDKSNLSQQALDVVGQAVAAAKQSPNSKVSIVGNTDSVASHAYNQGLSDRRAASAKAEMVSEGIPEGSISTVGKSFDNELVPTGPGVDEPQNRRDDIDITP